jgi:hypothetical protein
VPTPVLPSIPNSSGKLLALGDFNGDGNADIAAVFGGTSRTGRRSRMPQHPRQAS